MSNSNDVRRNKQYSSASEGVRIPVTSLGRSQYASVKCETVSEYYVSKERTIELGRQKARRYCPPVDGDFSFNLNIGYEDWDSAYGHCKDLELITKWLMKTVEEGISLDETLQDVNVVIARGLLRRIAVTPRLVNYVKWSFIAQRKHGIIFIQATDEEYIPSVESPVLSVYHGIKFESFITRESNETAANPTQPVKSNEMFRTVCRVDVNVNQKKFTILVTGEIDALDKDGNYIEIKLAKASEDGLLAFNKCLKTWLQCSLANVNRVVLGFKDEQGIVKQITEFGKDDLITKMNRSGRILPQQNFQFLHRVIERIDESLKEGETCSVEFNTGNYHAVLTPLPDAESLLSPEFCDILNKM